MKHLIETTDSSGLATVPYDRIVLDTTTNEIVCKGGGYEYVDLGLPSGLKWAKCNVGAKTETDYGDYFQWGDIVDKNNADCSWESYKYCNGTMDTLTKYNINRDFGTVDNKITLDPEDDAARANMGGEWRMPTKAEIQELLDNTDYEWIEDYNGSGVKGRKFTSKKEGYQDNSIFIPAAGYCSGGSVNDVGSSGVVLSSLLYAPYPIGAWSLDFNSGSCSMFYSSRSYGLPVRGVFK